MKLEGITRLQVAPGMLLLGTKASLFSTGNERRLVDLVKKSHLDKAKSRPDLLKKVLANTKQKGFSNNFRKF